MNKIGRKTIRMFRMKNRRGYAAICDEHLTEGRTPAQAYDRMVKAINRTMRKAQKAMKRRG